TKIDREAGGLLPPLQTTEIKLPVGPARFELEVNTWVVTAKRVLDGVLDTVQEQVADLSGERLVRVQASNVGHKVIYLVGEVANGSEYRIDHGHVEGRADRAAHGAPDICLHVGWGQ